MHNATENKREREVDQLLRILDEKTRVILWYLWWHRHAAISELRRLTNAQNDFELLYRLRDIINSRAIQLFGRPVVSFEQSKVDSVTGKKVLFEWWYLDEDSLPISNKNTPLVDIFEERHSVTIIAELHTAVDLADPDLQLNKGILSLRLCKRKHRARSGYQG